MKLDTSCENCVFQKVNPDNAVQYGCSMNFLENYKKSCGNAKLHGSYFVLEDKVCPYRAYSKTDPIDAYIKAIPKINFVVFYNNNEADLKKTITSIKNSSHFHAKGKIIVTYNTRNNSQIREIVKSCGIEGTKIKFVSILDDEADWLNESFKSSSNGYITFVNAGFDVPKDVFILMNHAINIGMKRVAYIKGVDEQDNLRSIMCVFAKLLKLDKSYDIETKIKTLQEDQKIDSQLIFSWKELNDSYYL